MKKLFSFLVLLSIVFHLSAQTIEENEYKRNNKVHTVMNSVQIHRVSGFGGPIMSYSTINGDFAFMMGGGGGIIINNLFLGGYGEGVSNNLTLTVKNENDDGNYSIRDLSFGHGGFWVGYEIARKKIIHPVISSRIGWGNVSGYNTTSNRSFRDPVFVVIPTISAEVNFTRFFKVNIGAEYRQTLNVNQITGMSNKDFSSLGVYMSCILGWF
jgi:hypothetical protein